MNTVHLSDDELRMVRSAMRSYLNTFGHDEADVVAVVKRVLAKLASAHSPSDPGSPVPPQTSPQRR